MAKFANLTSQGFDIFLANTFHDGLNVFLGLATTSYQLGMQQIGIIFPAGIKSIAIEILKNKLKLLVGWEGYSFHLPIVIGKIFQNSPNLLGYGTIAIQIG